MAELERRTTAAAPATQQQQHTQADIDSLPGLFGRLGNDVMTLVDTKLSLIKVELKEDAAVYARNGAMIAVGGVLAAIGFALFNVAVAFFISTLFTFDRQPLNYAMGFVLTSLLYLVLGGVLIVVFKNRLAAHNPVPQRTVEEIRKDKQWLKNEM
jgi:uncharacterized membrane protein YqjE